jgi:hypothetical protein
MPKPLLNRVRPDSIHEFRAAATERYLDAKEAAKIGRPTAAIYLCGYVAEMTLKAAYFSVLGFDLMRPITMRDLESARNVGTSVYQIVWPNPGKFHNVRAWSELLVEHRSGTPGLNYTVPTFGAEVRLRGRRIEPLWSETLRYHKNIAYLHEVERVAEAAGWLLNNSLEL